MTQFIDAFYLVVLVLQVVVLTSFAAALARPLEHQVAEHHPMPAWLRWPALVSSIGVVVGALYSIADVVHASAHVTSGVLARSTFGIILIVAFVLTQRVWLLPELAHGSVILDRLRKLLK